MALSTSRHRRNRQETFIWESLFSQRQREVYRSEDEKLFEPLPDEKPTTELIIRNFVNNGCDFNTHRYLYRKRRLEDFLKMGNIDSLRNQSFSPKSKRLVFVDDRNNSTVTESHLEGQCRQFRGALTAASFYHELLKNRVGLADNVDAERRLIYITDIDSNSALALAATASRFQAKFLRNFMHKHLAFQTYFGVQLPSIGWPTYCLSSNITYYAWRRLPPIASERAARSSKNVKRKLYSSPEEVIHLPKPHISEEDDDGMRDYIYEARISIMVTGLDDWFWTAYVFDDCRFKDMKHDDDCVLDPNQITHPILCGCLYSPTIFMDPLLCGKLSLNTPIWNPRHYFLLALSFRLEQVKEEWDNTVSQLLEEIEPCIYSYTRGEIGDGGIAELSITQEKGFKWAIRALRQFEYQLAKTINSWDKLKKSDLRYFKKADSELYEQPSWGALIDEIDKHILELENHRSALVHWTELLENMTNSIVTHAAHAETIIQRLQGQFIQTLTIVTIIFLPPSLASTVFSMQGTVVTNATFENWVLTLIGLFFATGILVGAIMLTNLPKSTNWWIKIRVIIKNRFPRAWSSVRLRKFILRGQAISLRANRDDLIHEEELDKLHNSSGSDKSGEEV